MGDSENKRNLNLTRLAACALWIVAWQAASLLIGSKILLASPLDTLRALVSVVTSERFLPIVWYSFSHVASGFLAAFALGVVLGFVAARHPVVRELLTPVVLAFKSIPVACIVVLLLIWVGSREVSRIAVFLMAFPALYLATVEGLGQVDHKIEEMLGLFGVGFPRRLLAHTWPSLLPYLMATSRNACGMAWKAGVAAELIGAPLGSIGERVYQSKILLETADLFAWTVIVVAVSYACEQAFLWVLRATGPLSLRLSVPRGGGRRTQFPPAPIELAGATIGHGDVAVARGVDLALAAGERGILTDASGAGKTTLLHTCAGLLPVLEGQAHAPHELSMVFQETRLIEAMTAEQNVLLIGAGGCSLEEVSALLAKLLPPEVLGRPVSELSGGQRRRVEIARALAHPSSAVLLDEPFSSLDDEAHRNAARFVLDRLEGRTLLVASHAPEDEELLAARHLSLS